MLHTLGLILILSSGSGLVLMALFGLAPGLIATRRSKPGAVRIGEKALLAVADLTPRAAMAASMARRAPRQRVDLQVVDELFSELFSLRADVAVMTEELRYLRERLESAAVLTPIGDIERERDRLAHVA